MDHPIEHLDTEFCTAHALFVAVERRGLDWLTADALALLGESRAEFTDFDLHRPTRWVEVTPRDGLHGLAQLHAAILATLVSTSSLPEMLRITRAADLVAQASAHETSATAARLP
jgi:hypothetical protein